MANNNNNTGLFVGFGVLIVLVSAGIILWPKISEAAQKLQDGNNGSGGGNNSSGGNNNGGSGVGTTPALNANLMLTNGVRGAEAKILQQYLNQRETANPLVVDGIIGPLTTAKMQRVLGTQIVTLKSLGLAS